MPKKLNTSYEVELFFSRAQKLQNSIHGLSHYGFSIVNFQKPADISKLLQNYPLELISESEKMSKCYQIIYCLENEIRKIVKDVLYENHDNDWWEKCVSNNIQDQVKKRQREDKSSFYDDRVDPIIFTTISELKEIIQNNYKDFESQFHDKRFAISILHEINRLRIMIYHNSPLGDNDIVMLIQFINRWSNQ